MTSSKLRVNDVKCLFAPLEPLPDEWQQDSIFLSSAVEECANVAISGQRCPCKMDGLSRFCIGFSHLCPPSLGHLTNRVFYSQFLRLLLAAFGGFNPFWQRLGSERAQAKPTARSIAFEIIAGQGTVMEDAGTKGWTESRSPGICRSDQLRLKRLFRVLLRAAVAHGETRLEVRRRGFLEVLRR